MIEVYKDIPSYEGLYQISNLGNVKSLKRKGTPNDKVLRQQISKNDKYLHVILHKNRSAKTYRTHSLMAISFLNHKPNRWELVIDHINNIKTDNRLDNIQIITQRINSTKDYFKRTSKYTGVNYDKHSGKWMSRIWIDKKSKFLGRHETEYDAHLAYQEELNLIQC